MARLKATRIASPRGTAFSLPDDGQAWWAFLSACLGGSLLPFHLGLPDTRQAALLLSMAGIFLCSEWVSNLGGRGRQGAVPHASLLEPLGIGLGAIALAGLATFLYLTPGPERGAWVAALTAVACLTALLFVLRLELVPLDTRLVALAHLLATLPCLLLGFLGWGVGDARAFALWAWPALYFPSHALLTRFWLEGGSATPHALSLIAAPLLATLFGATLAQAWIPAGALAIFLARALWLLRTRLGEARTPGFADIRRLYQEMHAWNAFLVTLWLLEGWRRI